jgi:hypothetical protein
VVEPIRQTLGETEFATAIDKLTNNISGFCASARDDAQ